MSLCPCRSGLPLEECCHPYLTGDYQAPTPELLMRSRFSAFTLHEWPYILRTWHPQHRPACSIAELAAEAEETQWVSLTVLASGQDLGVHSGWVDFCAYYRDATGLHIHHELSSFVREQEQWFYTQGKFLPAPAELKLKPNMLCPCGSAIKYKKCCAMIK